MPCKRLFVPLIYTAVLFCPFAQAETVAAPQQLVKVNNSVSSDTSYLSAEVLSEHLNPRKLRLRSSSALVVDEREGVVLYEQESNKVLPIASVTKLMTAIVTLDAKLPLDEHIQITKADRDRLRGSRSRLSYGTTLTRKDLLYVTLAASENRGSAALARTYPGGKKAFVAAMNAKARQLGMHDTHFKDSSGLYSENTSTAKDLVRMVATAAHYPLISEMTTGSGRDSVTDLRSGWEIEFLNTNRLVRVKNWDIELSKTGYLADAGHCLVMKTNINDRPVIVVLLNSWGKYSKFGDANRIKSWLEKGEKKALRASPDRVASSL